MFDALFKFYIEFFLKMTKEGKDGFLIVKSTVALKLLNNLYVKLVNENEIIPINELPEERKLMFWEIAKKYYDDQDKCILASKAAYALTWLTNTD